MAKSKRAEQTEKIIEAAESAEEPVSRDGVTYELSVPVSALDKLMQPYKELAAQVTSIGECDGFFTIYVHEGSLSSSSERRNSLSHTPPVHCYIIDRDGNKLLPKDVEREEEAVYKKNFQIRMKINKTAKKDGEGDLAEIPPETEKELEALYKQLVPEVNNKIYYTVDAYSWMPSADAKLKARGGFWTRITSESLDAALKETQKLWAEEHKAGEGKDRPYVDYSKKQYAAKLIERMYGDWSIEPVLHELEHEDDKKKSLLAAMTPFQLFEICDFVWDMEQEIEWLKKFMKKCFNNRDFKKYRAATNPDFPPKKVVKTKGSMWDELKNLHRKEVEFKKKIKDFKPF